MYYAIPIVIFGLLYFFSMFIIIHAVDWIFCGDDDDRGERYDC
jgi:hypothetical protein